MAPPRTRGQPELYQRLLAALPENYMVDQEDDEILADLHFLERFVLEEQRQLDMRNSGEDGAAKIVLYDWSLASLSQLMPVLTNLRLHVLEEKAFEFPWGQASGHMQCFLVQSVSGLQIDSATSLPRLRTLLFGILNETIENDPLNALLFACDFDWRQINLMMMLRNYLMQVGTVSHPPFCRLSNCAGTRRASRARRWQAGRSNRSCRRSGTAWRRILPARRRHQNHS